jgi:hypothetical protein
MTILTEGRAFPQGVPRWMGRIEVGARHKACPNEFRHSRGSRWVCGPSGLLPSGGGIGW